MTHRRTAQWLAAPLAAALIAGGIFAARRWSPPDRTAERAADVDRAAAVATTAPVDDFLVFARTPRGTAGETAPDDIATGLRRLAGALDSLDIGGDELAVDLRVASAHVLLQPASLENAALVRQLAIRAAHALSRSPSGAIVAARAEAISDASSLVQQQPRLQAFFAAAGDALAARHTETTR